MALAGTVEKSETVAGLSDYQLFERLFHQRHQQDQSLLLMGQVCSLVYSFNGQDVAGDEAELPVLASLAGKSADDLYLATAELKRRDLLQERGKWRAVLPHAIANRLAATALQNIPFSKIEVAILQGSSERLIKSFTRRLGYLDSSKEARTIVERWLSIGGYLADVKNLTDFGKDLFHNIAPVVPEATLSAIERELNGADREALNRCEHLKRLLRSISYDSAYFERAVAVLLQFVKPDEAINWSDEPSSIIESLFHIYLSGTHASCEQRLALVDGWLASEDRPLRELGLRALKAMMQTGHFTSSYNFEFGARSRDYGYMPRTRGEVRKWYTAVLSLAEKSALSDGPVSEAVRKVVGNDFRGLWTDAGRFDDLERIARSLSEKSFWREGWIGARQTRHYDGEQMKPEVLDRLTKLEAFLRPTNLLNQVRAVVLNAKGGGIDIDDFEDGDEGDYAAASARHATLINNLGRDVANDDQVRSTLLPEVISGSGHLFQLGHGMALGAPEPMKLWEEIVGQFAVAERPNDLLLRGFLRGLQERDAVMADAVLEEAVERPSLSKWYPALEAAVAIDDKGVLRLHRALSTGHAPIENYMSLAWGRASDPISGADLKILVAAISGKPNGQRVALEIISMRLHGLKVDGAGVEPEVLEAGRELLAGYEFGVVAGSSDKPDYELGTLIQFCLRAPEGASIVRDLIARLREASKRYDTRASDYDDLVRASFKVHPKEALSGLFIGDAKAKKRGVQLVSEISRHRKNPFKDVPDVAVIGWCNEDAAARYPWVASIALLYERADDKSPHEWTSLTRELLQNAPEPMKVLAEIVHRVNPTSWSGSFAAKLESRAALLNKLDVSLVPELQASKDTACAKLLKDAAAERKAENDEEKGRSGRFE